MRGKKMSDVERWKNFLSQIEKTEQCWNWKGQILHGYGVLWNGKRKMGAHRFMWEHEKGAINNSKILVCHTCDNRKCVRLSHLFLGDHHDNWADAKAKGKSKNPPHKFGSDHYQAKLTPQKALEIFISDEPGMVLSKRYEISHGMVYYIRKGITWKQFTNNELAIKAKKDFSLSRDVLLAILASRVLESKQ